MRHGMVRRDRSSLALDGRQLKPAKVTEVGEQKLKFVLTEGRNRQIRRMCELVDLRVVDLFRVRIGPLKLGSLPEGKWRVLTGEERAKAWERMLRVWKGYAGYQEKTDSVIPLVRLKALEGGSETHR